MHVYVRQVRLRDIRTPSATAAAASASATCTILPVRFHRKNRFVPTTSSRGRGKRCIVVVAQLENFSSNEIFPRYFCTRFLYFPLRIPFVLQRTFSFITHTKRALRRYNPVVAFPNTRIDLTHRDQTFKPIK